MEKTIGEILKEQGLNVSEEVAMETVRAVFKALPIIAAVTENKYDDMLVPIISIIQTPLLEIIDKLDGECDLCK